jgi:hydroxymethylbilane synthase
MSRIVLGNRGSVLALSQARAVLSDLVAEWPDVNITLRTIQSPQRPEGVQAHGAQELLAALQQGKINIALQALEHLPAELPAGLELAAVTKRLEPRYALVCKGSKGLVELPEGARVGVQTTRDSAFLKASRKDLVPVLISDGNLDDDLNLLAAGELDALVLPAACLIQLDRRQHIAQLLEPDLFAPAVGQGCLGLVVRDDDHLAADLAYTLQHRPSFDRITAERSFAASFAGQNDRAVSALATVTSDGEMALFGVLVGRDSDLVLHAETSGDASEAGELGRELAQDVLEQLKGHVLS